MSVTLFSLSWVHNCLSNGRSVNILMVSSCSYNLDYFQFEFHFQVYYFCFFDALLSLLTNFLYLAFIIFKNAKCVSYWENRRQHSYTLCVCSWTDMCVVTNHRQTLKEVIWVVIDHDVCMLFTSWFVNWRARKEICSLCSYLHFRYWNKWHLSCFVGELRLFN